VVGTCVACKSCWFEFCKHDEDVGHQKHMHIKSVEATT